jgi:ethanolamine ammonia-lyase small subunit
LSRRLEALGDRVRRWQRLDRPDSGIRLSDEAVAALHEQIAGADAEHVIVIVSAAGDIEVVPYSAV